MSKPLSEILHGSEGRCQVSSPISWEDGRSGLHDGVMRVQTAGPFHAGSETWIPGHISRHTTKLARVHSCWYTATQALNPTSHPLPPMHAESERHPHALEPDLLHS